MTWPFPACRLKWNLPLAPFFRTNLPAIVAPWFASGSCGTRIPLSGRPTHPPSGGGPRYAGVVQGRAAWCRVGSDGSDGRSGGADGQYRPRAHADAITVTQAYPRPGGYLAAVDLGAVGRPGVEDRPASVVFGDQNRMQVRDARVGRRAGQVDLRVQPARHAAAADAHLRSLEPEPALRTVCGELEPRGLRAAGGDNAVEVGPVGRHHGRPRGRARPRTRVRR